MDRRVTLRVGLLLLLASRHVGASDANLPHLHNGIFKQYTAGPPNKAGFRLTAAEIERWAPAMPRAARRRCRLEAVPLTMVLRTSTCLRPRPQHH